jgi:Fe2+ or Zn2+ uptake regulation protein
MRKTPLLQAVTEILTIEDRPLSVPEILEVLQAKNFSPNKTTLYRMLDKLVENEKVEALLLDPKVTYYEIKTHHHHQFRCKNCSTIKCITDSGLESQIHDLSSKLAESGLSIDAHNFSLSGTCGDCQ